MLTYPVIARNIEKAGSVKKGLMETSKQTGYSYWTVRTKYYQYLHQMTNLCKESPVVRKPEQESFWDKADKMTLLFEQGQCPEAIAKLYNVKADTVLHYIKVAKLFPSHLRMTYEINRLIMYRSSDPVKSMEILKQIEEIGGRKAVRTALQAGCSPESLQKALNSLLPVRAAHKAVQADDYTVQEILDLQKERDFYFRRMKALERINLQYIKTLQKLIDKEKSQKEFQREYGLKALEDPVFNEFSPSLVELRKKCRDLEDLSDFYGFLQFVKRLIEREKGSKTA